MLARAGAPVPMLGRPSRPSAHLQAMQQSGLRIDSFRLDERVSVETSSRPEVVAEADLVLFCVKSMDTVDAAMQIAPHIRGGTVVLDLQNGVDNPDKLRQAGLDPIIAVVYVAAAIETPGEVKHRGRGDLTVGHPSRPDDVARISGWLGRAGIPCRVSDDVEAELWFKLVLNSMANATSALTDATYRSLADFEPTWEVALDVAREGVAVARKVGHDLELDEVIRRGLEVCHAVGAATSSTQQDMARGRPTEIDALNGYIARRGAELDVPTPTNRILWALVKLREQTRAT